MDVPEDQTHTVTLERIGWMLIALTALLAAALTGYWVGARAVAQPSPNDAAKFANPQQTTPLQTTVRCRQGAFTAASAIINSVTEIALALPATTPPPVSAELDTVLYNALKQARDEVQCVTGVLQYGYERAYIAVLRRASALAKSRSLDREVIRAATETMAILERAAHTPDAVTR